MKYLVFFFVLALVGLPTTTPTGTHSRGCIYILGRCSSECPVGTHGYATGCGRKMPEATCDAPNPVLEEGIICDYSACYCDPPTVRDTVSNKCVSPNDCPKKE
uniref:Putative protease inhibitor 4 n=1 Tax=Lonomia obliqua TaxID=304329 RepID=Q5MGH4_LONON|nr:putative protease inhibitor 4 [Lonomia obliqua]